MAPTLSVIVVAHGMVRELPRTLYTLGPDYQRGLDAGDYEIVVVDNGSPEPVDEAVLGDFSGRLRATRGSSLPRRHRLALRIVGLDMAEGEIVGSIIDGARMASPGLLFTPDCRRWAC